MIFLFTFNSTKNELEIVMNWRIILADCRFLYSATFFCVGKEVNCSAAGYRIFLINFHSQKLFVYN